MGSDGEGCQGCEDGADPGEQNIGAVEIRMPPQFAPEAAKPEDGPVGPRGVEAIDEQRGKQDEEEETVHPFQGVDADVFDAQAALLIEAIGVLDPQTETPVGVARDRVGFLHDGDVGEEDEVAIQLGIVDDQHPEEGGAAGQANREPPQADGDRADLTRVGEGDLEMHAQGGGRGQIRERFALPAIQRSLSTAAGKLATITPSGIVSIAQSYVASWGRCISPDTARDGGTATTVMGIHQRMRIALPEHPVYILA